MDNCILNNHRTFVTEMNSNKHPNYQNAFTKCLLAAVLLLSFFVFSGSSAQSQTKQNVQQTTLLINRSNRLVKTTCFNGALRHIYCNHHARSVFVISAFNLANLHSLQIKTSIIRHCSPGMFISKKAGFFYRTKTIPQNTGDEPAIALG